MDIKQLKYLLQKPEGPKLDFKEKLSLDLDSDKKEFTKDVCSIANSRGGRGYIIFGIQDKTKKVLGVELTNFDEEKLQQIIANRIDPVVPIRVETFEYMGKNIVVVTIFNSDQKPHQILYNGSFYIRRGSTTGVARIQEIADMLQERGIIYVENSIMKHLTMDALAQEKMKKLLNDYAEQFTEGQKYLLQGLGIIKQDVSSGIYHPTMGGMLLFGKTPQTFLPHTGIKFRYNNVIHYLKGTILEMLDESNKIIEEILGGSGYPVHALEQAIENALVHRDYWDTTKEIEVNITKEKIEVINPGIMLSSRAGYENNIVRRNPWLYERLLIIDDKKRYLKHGTGIEKIKQAFEYSPKIKFVNIYKYNLFKLILPGTREYRGEK